MLFDCNALRHWRLTQAQSSVLIQNIKVESRVSSLAFNGCFRHWLGQLLLNKGFTSVYQLARAGRENGEGGA